MIYLGEDGPEPKRTKAIQNEENNKTMRIRNLFEECRIKDTLITELKDSIAQKDRQIEAQKSNISLLTKTNEANMSEKDQCIESLKDLCNMKDGLINKLNDDIEQKDQEIEELKISKGNLRLVIKAKQSHISEFRKTIKQLKEEIKQKDQQIETQAKRLSDTLYKYQSLINNIYNKKLEEVPEANIIEKLEEKITELEKKLEEQKRKKKKWKWKERAKLAESLTYGKKPVSIDQKYKNLINANYTTRRRDNNK